MDANIIHVSSIIPPLFLTHKCHFYILSLIKSEFLSKLSNTEQEIWDAPISFDGLKSEK